MESVSMLFDRLAGIVERHIKDATIRKMMDDARIFNIDFDTMKSMCGESESTAQQDMCFIKENKYMPFDTICFCTKSSIAFFTENEWLLFFESIKDGESVYAGISGACGKDGALYHRRTYKISKYKTYDVDMGNKHTADYYYIDSILKSEWIDGWSVIELLLNALASFIATIKSLANPSKFIVEDAPSHKIRHQKCRILRSVDRPIYTVLTPGEIRKRYAPHTISTETTGAHTAPHERRGHMRTYRDERYKAMLGKQQWIPACWVGPSEFPVGRRIYKVILDR